MNEADGGSILHRLFVFIPAVVSAVAFFLVQ